MQYINPELVGISQKRLEYIDAYMQHEVENGTHAGISTLVARKNEIVHCSQFGLQNREQQLPVTKDTIFRVYSMTKPIVCAALMTLFEKGMFDLHDPIEKYIPCFSHMKVVEQTTDGKEILVDAKSPITIEQLFTHTSGLAYGFYDDTPANAYCRQAKIYDDAVNRSLKEVVETIASLPLAHQPGEKYYYSSSIDVLGYLIEVLSGQSLPDFLQQTLFKPLDMQHTYFYVPEGQRQHVSQVYGGCDILKHDVHWSKMMGFWFSGKDENIEVNSTDPIDDLHYARGGHGLKMTAQDYYKFASMLLNKGAYADGQLLSPKTIELMQTNHLSEKQMPVVFQEFVLEGLGFGLGGSVLLSPAQAQMLGSVGNYGWSGAAHTHFWVDPKEELVAIFMAQSLNNFSNVHIVFQNLVYQSIVI